jgi:hypothetical protein
MGVSAESPHAGIGMMSRAPRFLNKGQKFFVQKDQGAIYEVAHRIVKKSGLHYRSTPLQMSVVFYSLS